MRREPRRGDRSRHGEAVFEQRPVEGLAVKGEKHRALGYAGGHFIKQGILLREIPHEKLFNLQSAGIPPRQANEKSTRAGAAGEPGRFGVEEEPLRRIFERGARSARERFLACAGKQLESDARRSGKFGSGEPVSNGEMFAEMIPGNPGAE